MSTKWLTRNKRLNILALLFVAIVALSAVYYWKVGSLSQPLLLAALTSFVALVWGLCSLLTDIFSLRKKDSAITWCQITILVAIGIWIVGVLLIFNIRGGSDNTLLFGIVGGIVTLIFQEKIKGAVTFLHLRANKLLRLGDWIQVPKFNIDGEVRKVTLTTVTLYNWDTTTSTIPISALHDDHFINLQHMLDGRTFGWRMSSSFIIDTQSFHPLSSEEVQTLKSGNSAVTDILPPDLIAEGTLNASLYRQYLYHWLSQNSNISHYPRLMVRWLDQTEAGIPLLVYTYIITDNINQYEWQMSVITEHIAQTLPSFGLRLYQRPSSIDIQQLKKTQPTPQSPNS